MGSMGYPQLRPSPIKCDADSSVKKAKSATSNKRSLYMVRRIVFTQRAQTSRQIGVAHTPGDRNRADILTKPLSRVLYERLRDVIMNVRAAAAYVHSLMQWQVP